MPPWNPIQPTCHPERQHKAHGLCIECYSKQYKRKPESMRRHVAQQRRGDLKRLYGITEDDYNTLL